MRQEQEEAPRKRRGHPGGRRGRGWLGVEERGGSPGEGEPRDEGWGWGAVSLPLSPRAPWAPAPPLSPVVRPAPAAAGAAGRPGGLSSSHTRTHTSRSLSHTLTLTHSLTLPYTQTERQRRTTAGTSSKRGGREGTRGTRPRLSQKRREAPGCLRATPQPAPAVARHSCRRRHPEDRVEEAGEPLPKAAAKRTTWDQPQQWPGPRLQYPESTGGCRCCPYYNSAPHGCIEYSTAFYDTAYKNTSS
ncbi:hypothetical protein P7K49_012354 [Saguinus oedipus]|uniref:Uncharacterized protein n=1 Tax=Saguinus oedipus TaxID=9490 RepID=A0ABQ9VTB6_SAGOE|nr:hypothetical protein P7K49_012354 [Saguinus oedipus]